MNPVIEVVIELEGEADYLLGVCDEARQGALRFRFEADGPYQAPSGPHTVPPLVDLPRLLSSSERVSRGDADSEDLLLLLAPGSSMGGARPKACIRDRSGKRVLSTAVDYGLSKERGVAVIEEVVAALEGWVAVAKACGLNSSQIERMRSAFEHPERML